MANNSQVLLEELVQQEKDNLDKPITESRFFEFFSASQILKAYELSFDEIEAGLTGEGLGGHDKVAKGPKLLEELKEKLREKIS